MLKRIQLLLLVFFLLIAVAVPGAPEASETTETVYIVSLSGPVEKGLFRFLQRAFSEAERQGAAAIILELNTYGGMIDAASDISDLIFDSPIPVHAYVRYRAISAGAYLALSCRSLYMAPGSTIGAAEPRSITGGEDTVDEKTISVWEAEMRKVAGRQGKDPKIAAAMVRREIEIEGVVQEGYLLTLTDSEALDIGFTEGVMHTRNELLAELGLAGADIVMPGTSPAEDLARFITHPAVATILITIGFVALVIEVMTAGFGVAGAVSVMAFALFFGGHIFAGLAGREVIFLFMLGVVLLLVEAVMPNFGIIGLSGLGAIVASVVLSAATTGEGMRIFGMSLFLTVVTVALAVPMLKRTTFWSQIILQYTESKELGYVGPADASSLVGLTGITLTPLRPAGTAEIGGKRVDVVSEGGFIALGTEIKVVTTEGTRIVVRAVQK